MSPMRPILAAGDYAEVSPCSQHDCNVAQGAYGDNIITKHGASKLVDSEEA